MKKLSLVLAACSAVALSSPAWSQGFDSSVDVRIGQLQADLDAGLRSGTIDRTEARTLREEMRSLRQMERAYSRDGLSRTERQALNDEIRDLRQQVNFAQRDGGRYNQYGQNAFIDRNRDGYDDRDYDRDGRWTDDVRTNRFRTNGYGGMGGPYEEVSQVCGASRGISGVLGAILGSDNCLSVGERVSNRNSLSMVPSQHRDDFRDGGGYYHRYLNGHVIQLDGRTGTVAGIYAVD